MKIKEKVLKEVLEQQWISLDGKLPAENVIKDTIDKTLAEAEKEFIRRTKLGLCLICKKKDKFSKETVCGDCSLKWLEKKKMLKDYIKKAEVGKVIDETDFEEMKRTSNIEELSFNGYVKGKLKQKLGIK